MASWWSSSRKTSGDTSDLSTSLLAEQQHDEQEQRVHHARPSSMTMTSSSVSSSSSSSQQQRLCDQPNPLPFVWICAVPFLLALSPLLRLGRTKLITPDDVWNLEPADRASAVFQRFQRAWLDEVRAHRNEQEEGGARSGSSGWSLRHVWRMWRSLCRRTSSCLSATRRACRQLRSHAAKPTGASASDRDHVYTAHTDSSSSASSSPSSSSSSSSPSTPSSALAIAHAFYHRFLYAIICDVFYQLFSLTVPYWIRAVTDVIYHPTNNCTAGGIPCGYLYAIGLALSALSASTFINTKWYNSYRGVVLVRSALMSAIYAKALRLSSSARASSTTGQILNLMSNDCARVAEALQYIGSLIIAPTVVVVSLFMMYAEIGASAFAAFAMLMLIIPLQARLATYAARVRKKMIEFTDARVKFMSEILLGIRVIKMYAWEEPVAATIAKLRRSETVDLYIYVLLRNVVTGILFVYPQFVTFVTFVVYSYAGNDVVPTTVYTVLALLNVVRFPMSTFPQAVALVTEARISLQRIERFLVLDELPVARVGEEAESAASAEPSSSSSSSSLSSLSPRTALSPPPRATRLPVGSVSLRNCDFRWLKDSPAPILTDINLDIAPGELVGVIGMVGAGKSSLLAAMLNEMLVSRSSSSSNSDDPTVALHGRVSYMHQKSWIRNATIENNILFGEPKQRALYDRCVYAAALGPDLAILPAGDQTEIGEQGLNLSGGQKARVSLARALYRHDADVFVFDDPFSAVDMHVGKHMFEHAVLGMLAGKTRIIVLNSHLHLLERFDRIVVLVRGDVAADQIAFTPSPLLTASGANDIASASAPSSGRIAAIGSFAEISVRFPELMHIIEAETEAEKEEAEDEEEVDGTGADALEADGESVVALTSSSQTSPTPLPPAPAAASAAPRSASTLRRSSLPSSPASSSSSKTTAATTSSTSATTTAPGTSPSATSRDGRLTQVEDREKGKVRLRVYLRYFRSASFEYGGILLLTVLILYAAAQTSRLLADFWLLAWARDNELVDDSASDSSGSSGSTSVSSYARPYWVGSWFGWIAAATVLTLTRCWLVSSINVRSSGNLHDQLFARLLKAPTNLYFDLTPSGRILNRFTKDLDSVDALLPIFMSEFMLYACQFVGTILVAVVVSPFFLLVFAVLITLFVYVVNYFRSTSRELKRIEGITRSPIFSSFGEMLNGLQTIRAFGEQKRFIEENARLVDLNSKLLMFGWLVERWLSIRLELCSATIILCVAMLSVALRSSVDPSLAGLALTYALQMVGLLQWTVRLFIQTENTMTAVERLSAIDEIPIERAYRVAPSITSVVGGNSGGASTAPSSSSSSWPHAGRIVFSDVYMRYRPELELVLRGVSCSIEPGEHVGICGRTGSGKSSLMMALFRMIELERGSIQIDGVDIADVGLHALRSALSIIPQDPTLFSGTVRYNLDPFEERTDAEVWSALESVSLASAIRELQGGLQARVAESGDNFSHGQRQLICIARALLRRSKVLVMDEATAAIDTDTDRRIQETIAQNFARCTILTIAHRLHTIIRYSRVLVLHNGAIVEFDRPSVLLRRAGSAFRSMVEESGDSTLLTQFIEMADTADAARGC